MINRKTRHIIKKFVPNYFINLMMKYQAMYNVVREFGGRHSRQCSICGYSGFFFAYGQPLEHDAVCPGCRSIGRHRQHHLIIERHGEWIDNKAVLHFAPEPAFVDAYARRAAYYVRADLDGSWGVAQVDMQAIPYAEVTFDTIIAHNVIEHVADDCKALSELHRVLKCGGRALLSAPVIEAWPETYENPLIQDYWERDLHFNQWDHVRLYGRDIRQRIRSAGFDLSENVAREPEVSRYALLRGETIFIAKKKELHAAH